MIPQAPVAISLNFDSLNEAFGFPQNFSDPSFSVGFDRCAELAARYGIKLSIYVIGRDLTNRENFARVREWSQQGHEIGNHSWSHYMGLGGAKPQKLDDEIRWSHDIIQESIGMPPRGFIAPAWSSSNKMFDLLIQLGYQYDTSVFSSFLLYPLVASVALSYRKTPKRLLEILGRGDWLDPFFKPIRPFVVASSSGSIGAFESGELIVLPLPTMSRFLPTFWHTVGFMFGWKYARMSVKQLLRRNSGFYYLMHPADFLGPNDFEVDLEHALVRMDVPLAEKMARLEEGFVAMKESGRPLGTMSDLAEFHKNRLEIL